MPTNVQDLLTVLKNELKFLNDGGYAKKGSWKPSLIFEDSPTCLNYNDPGKSLPCSECLLWQLVPADKRSQPVPCRHIPINSYGETLDGMYRYGTRYELETTVRKWLEDKIKALERDERQTAA
jgi:hypothetical protein